ncbi:hypothetical protein SDC9_148742 [bioreactor metagenome]|uniref:Uncharacterized protein n=1 Tax=bioreactor metagenome TaxID=1076179 RepID=A0A645ELX1_9ZZZZ
MRAGLAPGEHRTGIRLHRIDFNRGVALLEHLPHAGQGAARADSGHKSVHLPVGIAPDLLGRMHSMIIRVGRIVELLGYDRIRVTGVQLFGFGNGALHAGGAVGQHQLGAIGGQEFAPLHAHGFRHGQNQPVTLDRRHQRQADAGIAAGRFDDQSAGLEYARLLRGLDHRQRDAVFDRTARIERFDFGHHFGATGIEFGDAHQRRVSDLFQNAVGNVAHRTPLMTPRHNLPFLSY